MVEREKIQEVNLALQRAQEAYHHVCADLKEEKDRSARQTILVLPRFEKSSGFEVFLHISVWSAKVSEAFACYSHYSQTSMLVTCERLRNSTVHGAQAMEGMHVMVVGSQSLYESKYETSTKSNRCVILVLIPDM